MEQLFTHGVSHAIFSQTVNLTQVLNCTVSISTFCSQLNYSLKRPITYPLQCTHKLVRFYTEPKLIGTQTEPSWNKQVFKKHY